MEENTYLKMCRWGDLNSQSFRNTPLKRTCLPISPQRQCHNLISYSTRLRCSASCLPPLFAGLSSSKTHFVSSTADFNNFTTAAYSYLEFFYNTSHSRPDRESIITWILGSSPRMTSYNAHRLQAPNYIISFA